MSFYNTCKCIPQKRNVLWVLLSNVILLFPIILSGCGNATTNFPVEESAYLFDTVITVSCYGENARDAVSKCIEEAKRYDLMFNPSYVDSDISLINNSGGNPVTVNDETIDVLNDAIFFAELTDGLADPTIGAEYNLWDFHSENPVPPDSDKLAEAATHVDYRLIEISDNTVTLKDPLSQVSLGFIAKGYIADRLRETIISNGVTSAIINLGGNVLCIGTKPDGSDYNIGIRDPFGSDEPVTSVRISDLSVVTAGIYERCFKYNDTLYHHILDPKTGISVDSDLVSATIISDNSTQCDAVSTICILMGRERAKNFLSALGVKAILIDTDKNIEYINFDS